MPRIRVTDVCDSKELERSVARYLAKRCKETGFHLLRLQVKGVRGAPDYILTCPLGSIYIELKRPIGGVLSPAQAITHKAIKDAGGRVEILKNKDEVDKLIFSLIREGANSQSVEKD